MNNQIMNIEENELNIFEQGNQKPAYCSIVAESFDDKAKIFNAMSSPDERLRNHINEIIKIRDVYCEIVECVNKETRETSEAPRVVLIDTEGKSYQCVSTGIFNSLKRLFTVFGMPTWDKGVPCKVKQVSNGERQILTLVVANK